MFLNEEKKKLKDCTDEEIAAIVRASGTRAVQKYRANTTYPDGWTDDPIVRFVGAMGTYRIKPRPMTINWDHVGEGWNHLRVDSDGSSWFFRSKPKVVAGRWGSPDGHAENDDNNLFSSFQRGGLPWDEAICDRPGHE